MLYGLTFLCPKCDYQFTEKRSVLLHIKSVHGDEIFLCPKYDFKFIEKGSFMKHIKSIQRGTILLIPKESDS